eukprot:NODE_31280_length_400_cov_1.791209.p3 GENE.NODE_31280_length_400_cov_1.791209~~NODE_31280_length_400_cov_1.791209.p3  ORF type:complete len:61 (-),score=7.72 NODE_31280_length_400_cov_1.791209:123-305(-)
MIASTPNTLQRQLVAMCRHRIADRRHGSALIPQFLLELSPRLARGSAAMFRKLAFFGSAP